MHHRTRGQDGAVVVEFAAVFVLFAILLSGLIQYGVIFAAEQSLAHAASEATRAVVNITDDETPADGTADDASEVIAAVLADQLTWLDPLDGPDPDPLEDPDGTIVAADGRFVDYTVEFGAAAGCADCVEVTVTFNWADDALVPGILDIATPDLLTAAANVQYQ